MQGAGKANSNSREKRCVFVLYVMFQQTALLKAASNTVNKSGDGSEGVGGGYPRGGTGASLLRGYGNLVFLRKH